jgi:hypothetical protein
MMDGARGIYFRLDPLRIGKSCHIGFIRTGITGSALAAHRIDAG